MRHSVKLAGSFSIRKGSYILTKRIKDSFLNQIYFKRYRLGEGLMLSLAKKKRIFNENPFFFSLDSIISFQVLKATSVFKFKALTKMITHRVVLTSASVNSYFTSPYRFNFKTFFKDEKVSSIVKKQRLGK